MLSTELRAIEGGTLQAFTAEQVADMLNVHVKTIRREIARGSLRCIHVGRAVRITETQLRDYLEGGTNG